MSSSEYSESLLKVKVKLPGRLAEKVDEEQRAVKDDRRADPRLIKALVGLSAAEVRPVEVSQETSPDGIRSYFTKIEPQVSKKYGEAFVPVDGSFSYNDLVNEHLLDRRNEVETLRTQCTGIDGNSIPLFIDKPVGRSKKPTTAVLHFHGGGMAFQSAEDTLYTAYRHALAKFGIVVIGVEFRNTAGKVGSYSFPAGLNDCYSALVWVNEHKAELGVNSVIACGESGGGNLSIALALKAKREGKISYIQGVYAMCPFLSNLYRISEAEFHQECANLPSLYENNGYSLVVETLAAVAKIYTVDVKDQRNPLAWPYWATDKDLEGLPPFVISVSKIVSLKFVCNQFVGE
mmetsp:Transcript_1786/g.2539  ORF Transcript_1786/g.2539 Transcript_1786/m.2539 type:complete len:347 (-) Transcript_1786:3-1043(-)